MSYPNLPQNQDTSIQADAGVNISVSEGGKIRGVAMYPNTIYTINVAHKHLSDTDKDSIISHFNANKSSSFSFTYQGDNTVYNNCFYAGEPEANWTEFGWTVITKLIGNK